MSVTVAPNISVFSFVLFLLFRFNHSPSDNLANQWDNIKEKKEVEGGIGGGGGRRRWHGERAFQNLGRKWMGHFQLKNWKFLKLIPIIRVSIHICHKMVHFCTGINVPYSSKVQQIWGAPPSWPWIARQELDRESPQPESPFHSISFYANRTVGADLLCS